MYVSLKVATFRQKGFRVHIGIHLNMVGIQPYLNTTGATLQDFAKPLVSLDS